MEINSKMTGIMKNILLEAELKDIFSNISQGKIITITTTDGKKIKYNVISNMTGTIIMVDLVSKVNYVMDKDALINDELTINRYDSKGTDFKDKNDIKLNITSFNIFDKQNNFEEVDIKPKGGEENNGGVEDTDDEEDINNIKRFMGELDNVRVNDTLIMTYDDMGGMSKEKDSTLNHLFFKVTDLNKKIISLQLFDIEGGSSGEEFKKTKKYVNVLGDRTVSLNRKNPFKINNGSIETVLATRRVGTKKSENKGVMLKIVNLRDIEVNNINDDDRDDGDTDGNNKKYSEDDFYKWVNDKKHPERLELFNKQPGILGTIAGASPTGLYQLKNLMQKASIDSSYLGKNNKVTFKLISPNLVNGGNGHTMTSKHGVKYMGRMVSPRKIQHRDIGKGNFFLYLKEELAIDDMTFKVNIEYCDTNQTCRVVEKNATIKIIHNE